MTTRSNERRAAVLVALMPLVLAAACDGGGNGGDGGPPEVGLTITAAAPASTVMSDTGVVLEAGAGSQFYVVDLTIEAGDGGAIPVAPNAFTLVLADGVRSTASPGATNFAANGCTSRALPAGESVSCRVVFELVLDAADPERLEWSDGSRTVSAGLPG